MQHKRNRVTRRKAALIGSAAVIVAGTVGGTLAVASESDSPDASTTEQANPPADWRPWLTSFHAGDPDAGPADANQCTTSDIYGDYDEPAEDESTVEAVRCLGTGFVDETLSLVDGTHDPDAPKPVKGDFAKVGDVVLNDDYTDVEGSNGVFPGFARVRGLAEGSRDVRWEHRVREASLYHAPGDVVVGDEATDITNLPEDGDYEDWTPDYQPGGDIIAWDPVSGEEKWRVSDTPKDQWCSPEQVNDQLLVSCRAEQYERGEATWYRVDPESEKLRELYKHTSDGGARYSQPLDVVDGSLVFLRTDDATLPGPQELVLVDRETGEKQVKPLPEKIRGKAVLADGDLYFWQDSPERKLVAVDALTGERRWVSDTRFEYASQPAVSAARGEVYVADPAGRLAAFDQETGEEKWRTEEARAEDGGTNPDEMDPVSAVRVVRDLLVVSTGNTVFTVSPDEPDAEPEDVHRVELDT